jgi:hypothetical protein
MIVYHIAYCNECQKTWLVPLQMDKGVFPGVVAVMAGHFRVAPRCDADNEKCQVHDGEVWELPNWARAEAEQLLATVHWSQTSQGYKFWQEAFKVANLPDIPSEQLETGTHSNAEIARLCPNAKALLLLLMQLPKGGSRASARSVLSFTVDRI